MGLTKDWDPVAFVTGVMVVIGFLTWVVKVPGKAVWSFLHFMGQFKRDWLGEPAQPGRPAVPGMMERMQRIDGQMGGDDEPSLVDMVQSTAIAIDEIHHQLPCMIHPPCDECPAPNKFLSHTHDEESK